MIAYFNYHSEKELQEKDIQTDGLDIYSNSQDS